MFLAGRARYFAPSGPGLGKSQFGGDDGKLSGIRGVSFEDDMSDSGVPKTRERIRTLACENHKAFGFIAQGRQTFELASVDHHHTIEPQIRLIYEVDPMGPIAQQRITERLCVFAITNH